MFAKRRSIVTILLLSCLLVHAQEASKIDLQLRAYLEKHRNTDAMVDLFIHGDEATLPEVLRSAGGYVKRSLPGLVSARLPLSSVHQVATHSAVRRFEFSLDPGMVMNDSMRVKNHVEGVQLGLAPLPAAYDGEGVIMGIIDSGLDWLHPDFQAENGDTRVLKYWDQTLPVNEQTPQPYGYGQVWDSTQINAGQMTSVDQPQLFGHGSTVAGSAAGNGLANGRHKGVAPQADLIVVSAAFGSGNFRSRVADAVDYIFQEAQAMGRPAVVNASLGTYLGSHDGQDAAALFIDQLLEEQGGRVMVCAAGNSNAWAPYHLRTEVSADTSFTWFRNNNNSGLGGPAVFFEAWADTQDLADVHYAVGADRVNPSHQFRGNTPFHTIAENLDVILVDTLWSFSGNRIGIVQTYAAQRGGQYQLQVLIQQPDSAGYNFRFMTTGQGSFDVWSSSQLGTSAMVTNIPSVQDFPDIANYVMPDNDQHIVDSWACSPKVLAVANYNNELEYTDCLGAQQTLPGIEGDISASSSKGPARTGVLKPDVAASGDITFSAAPLVMLANMQQVEPFKLDEGCLHLRNGGTSMASPVVAGAVALYLQKCPGASWSEVREAITATAVLDDFTGTLPGNQWGHGKLHAFDALVTSNISDVVLDAPDPAVICGDGAAVVNGPDGFETYLWSNGGTGTSILLDEPGPLSLVVSNASGCQAWSDTVEFLAVPAPEVPQVEQDGLVLSGPEGFVYQWYLNGVPMVDETGQVHVVGTSGSYLLQVTDANGCTAFSTEVDVIVTGMDALDAMEPAIWPSPASTLVFLRMPALAGDRVEVSVHDATGRVVAWFNEMPGNTHTLSVKGLAAGTHAVRFVQGGRQWTSRFVKLP